MSRTQLRNALAIVCALAILLCCFGAATLGSRILRAETAVVTFAVLALAASGELP